MLTYSLILLKILLRHPYSARILLGIRKIKFSKIAISIRINLLLQVPPSELSFVYAAMCVISVSSLNVLSCNFYLSRNLVTLVPLTESRQIS